MQQQSVDHHYIPQFYLRPWTGEDGLVCVFSRPHVRLEARRRPPRATGFERHLYTVSGLPPGQRSILEDEFFRNTDQAAYDALRFMLANQDGAADMPPRLRSGWSRFMLSLMHRSPERVTLLKEKCRIGLIERLAEIEPIYDEIRFPSDPPTFEALKASLQHDVEHKTWAVLLQDVIDSPTVGKFLNAMRWSIVTIQNPVHTLLTSDRPIYMTNGLDHPEAQIILPVGPAELFVAVNTAEMEDALRRSDPRALMRQMNHKVTTQARRYVYDGDDRQLRFVDNRLGHQRKGR